MKRKLTIARVYALRGYTLKVEKGKFFISPSAVPNQGRKWSGPYKSLQHATTAVARKLQREFARRDRLNGGADVRG